MHGCVSECVCLLDTGARRPSVTCTVLLHLRVDVLYLGSVDRLTAFTTALITNEAESFSTCSLIVS
jgi:hypothetical protein